jgi:hypothetical protein
MSETWEFIKSIYKIKFNIPKYVLEYVAVYDILNLCACGYSNKKISSYVNQDVSYIEEVLLDFYIFKGWFDDLDISPLAVYNLSGGIYIFYEQEIYSRSLIKDYQVKQSFKICKQFTEIKQEIYRYYDKS